MDEYTVLQDIRLDKIRTEGQSVRYQIDDDHVVELSLSIMQNGLLEPIVVTDIGDGNFQLIAGSCRLAAFTRLRKDTIPAVIRPDDGRPIKGLALVENVVRRDMTLEEQVEAVLHLYEKDKLSPGQICDLVGKSRAWVDRRLAIPHLHPEVISDLLDGRITLRHAEIVNQVEAPQLRSLLLNNIVQSKLSARQSQELAELYLENPSIEVAVEAGIKKKQEIQEKAVPERTCDACGRIRELSNIKLVAVCADGCVHPTQPTKQPADEGREVE